MIETDAGETIIVSVQDFRPGHVRLGFEANKAVKILRRELYDKIQHGNHPEVPAAAKVVTAQAMARTRKRGDVSPNGLKGGVQ